MAATTNLLLSQFGGPALHKAELGSHRGREAEMQTGMAHQPAPIGWWPGS